MSNSFDPEVSDVPPEVPTDRAWASEVVSTIASHNAKVDGLVKENPVAWSSRIKGRNFSDKAANHLMDQIDWAGLVIETLIKQIEMIVPAGHEAFPRTIGAARTLLESVASLAGHHKEATLVARIEEFDEGEVSSLVADILHHRHTETALREALDHEDPLGEVCSSLIAAADLAVDILAEYDAATIEEANHALERLAGHDEDIKQRVRRMTVLATRLNLPDASADDVIAFARACSIAKTKPQAVLEALRDISPETHPIIEQLGRKVAKIQDASRLLDERFGKNWRYERIDKVSRASAIASTAGDPRHPKVADYARSFGVTLKFPQSLAAIVKTRVAMDKVSGDEVLKAMLPKTFRGLDTDFSLLAAARTTFDELHGVLGDRPGAQAFIELLSANSRPVVEDFLELSNLELVADGLPYPGNMPLRQVRVRHEQRKLEVANAIKTIAALPVPEGQREPATAKKLATLHAELLASRSRVGANPLIQDANAPQPDDILAALEWKERFSKLLPGVVPKNDEGFAHLLVMARQTIENVAEWRKTLKDIKDLLDVEHLPTDDTDLTAIQPELIDIRAIEPVVHAQVGLCLAMEKAMNGGLAPFIKRATAAATSVSSWPEVLARDYQEVDRIAAEEIFANELMQAAEDAATIGFDTTMTIPAPKPALPGAVHSASMGQWIEEEVVRQLGNGTTGKQLETAH